jgi:tubulin---tyrosine ligase
MNNYKRSGQTVILQKYIANPLLIHKRKFDIRCFALVTSHNGILKAYFYKEGYLRTSCKEYSLNNIHSRMVHLTNDAVQQNSEDYGKYEPGNKLSYTDFQKYLNAQHKDLCVDFERDLVPQI